jgi:hypothetical protein
MAPELLDDLPVFRNVFATHPNFNSINHGDFKTFYTSHNNDNGVNGIIYTYLAYSLSRRIRSEDLLVRKICDNGISTTG